ncbi:uncharacterized protein LOC111048982 [Nilaparvata lugens]|uniref:uncharacterized protein LOC111048982 n=1 Tax=Nilaparvata lugens TaxID=108931 RepID=UPI00193D850C|nr:uncharacterized protein LOC111048982 [Nilaparvata lugens]
MSVAKWLPREEPPTLEYIVACKKLHRMCCRLEGKLGLLLLDETNVRNDLCVVTDRAGPAVVSLMQLLASTVVSQRRVHHACIHWHHTICQHRLCLLYLLNQVIAHCLTRSHMHQPPLLRLIEIFNELHACNLLLDVKGLSVVKNTCPSLLQPLRKLTITKTTSGDSPAQSSVLCPAVSGRNSGHLPGTGNQSRIAETRCG